MRQPIRDGAALGKHGELETLRVTELQEMIVWVQDYEEASWSVRMDEWCDQEDTRLSYTCVSRVYDMGLSQAHHNALAR